MNTAAAAAAAVLPYQLLALLHTAERGSGSIIALSVVVLRVCASQH
jgi:hypothetical protein